MSNSKKITEIEELIDSYAETKSILDSDKLRVEIAFNALGLDLPKNANRTKVLNRLKELVSSQRLFTQKSSCSMDSEEFQENMKKLSILNFFVNRLKEQFSPNENITLKALSNKIFNSEENNAVLGKDGPKYVTVNHIKLHRFIALFKEHPEMISTEPIQPFSGNEFITISDFLRFFMQYIGADHPNLNHKSLGTQLLRVMKIIASPNADFKLISKDELDAFSSSNPNFNILGQPTGFLEALRVKSVSLTHTQIIHLHKFALLSMLHPDDYFSKSYDVYAKNKQFYDAPMNIRVDVLRRWLHF